MVPGAFLGHTYLDRAVSRPVDTLGDLFLWLVSYPFFCHLDIFLMQLFLVLVLMGSCPEQAVFKAQDLSLLVDNVYAPSEDSASRRYCQTLGEGKALFLPLVHCHPLDF